MASYGACLWRVDPKQGKFPFAGNIMEGEYHVPSSWKLQKDEVRHGDVVGSHPWRTEEKALAEVTEMVHRYTPVDGLVVDFTAGTGTTAIACRRTNRRVIINDSDPELVDAALLRLKYYHFWYSKNVPYQIPGHDPTKHDGLPLYGFLGNVLGTSYNKDQRNEDTLPPNNVPLGLPKCPSDEYDTYCASMV